MTTMSADTDTATNTTATNTNTPIILLREPTSQDRYESAFRTAGFQPASIPVLETVLCDVEGFVRYLGGFEGGKGGGGGGGSAKEDADTDKVDGVIVTSKRACEALGAALKVLQTSGRYESIDYWTRTTYYVVGESTASSIGSILTLYLHERDRQVDIRGQHTGNADALASFILEDVKSPSFSGSYGHSHSPTTPTQKSVKLLYVTGDKNRDTITRRLSESDLIELVPRQVYETRTRAEEVLEGDLVKVLKEFEAHEGVDESIEDSREPNNQAHPIWIAFFSPSSAQATLRILSKHLSFRTSSTSGGSGSTPGSSNLSLQTDTTHTQTTHGELVRRHALVAAIGPTTEYALRHELERAYVVDAVAGKPSPEGLVGAVCKAMGS